MDFRIVTTASAVQQYVCIKYYFKNSLTYCTTYIDPFFPMIFLVYSWFPGMLDALLQATFLCALLLFWLCIYHGLRQNERKFCMFYLPKLIVIMPIWLCAIVLATWEKCNELRDPTYSHFVDTSSYNVGTLMSHALTFFFK